MHTVYTVYVRNVGWWAINIIISSSGDEPIYEQISGQIKGAILRGELSPGDPLPSIRKLAKELRISVITTKRAYEELEKDGFINTIPSKGSYVADYNEEVIQESKMQIVESKLQEAIELGKLMGLSGEELKAVFSLLVEDD